MNRKQIPESFTIPDGAKLSDFLGRISEKGGIPDTICFNFGRSAYSISNITVRFKRWETDTEFEVRKTRARERLAQLRTEVRQLEESLGEEDVATPEKVPIV